MDQGDNVPQDIDPYDFREEGRGLRVTQTMPRLSKEAHSDYPQFLTMKDGLEDVFEYMREYVSTPVLYKCIS